MLLLQFNDLDEETLTRDRTLQKFKVQGRFMKDLRRVFPFEAACLIHDAVCGIDDKFKTPLEEGIMLETHKEETNEEPETQNEQEQIPGDSEEKNGTKLNFALNEDETQFDLTKSWDEGFKLPADKSKNAETPANEMRSDTTEPWEETNFKQSLTKTDENRMTLDIETQFDTTETNFKRPQNKSKDMMTLGSETQLDTSGAWDGTYFKQPPNKSEDVLMLNKNNSIDSEEFTKPNWRLEKLEPEESTQNTDFTNFTNRDQPFPLDTYNDSKFLSGKNFNMEQSSMEFSFPKSHAKTENPWEITQTDPINSICSLIDETKNSDASPEKNEVLKQDPKISTHLKPKPKLLGVLENPEMRCLNYQNEIKSSTDYTEKKLDFYPQETSDELESQLAKLMLEETETHFFDSLDWSSLSIETQSQLDGQCEYLEKFFCEVTQFNYLMSSKPFSQTYVACDASNYRGLKKLSTDNAGQKSRKELQPIYSGIKFETINLKTTWCAVKQKETEREEMLTKCLQEIFKHLDELINDFSKLHTTIFDYHDFLMRKAFPVIRQYFDERSADERINDRHVCNSLNICCNFIKKTINEIVATDELCGFLKWEEQRYLLSELCNSKIVCQDTLDFLLTQTVILLKCVEEKRKKEHQRIYQDPGIIEKLSIILPLMESLVVKFIGIVQRDLETSDCQDSEETNIFRLWEEEAMVEKKNINADILRDSDSNENENLDDKWMQDLELIVQLTEEKLIIFSLTAQKCLRALREARGGSKTKYTFSQSQTSSLDKQ